MRALIEATAQCRIGGEVKSAARGSCAVLHVLSHPGLPQEVYPMPNCGS